MVLRLSLFETCCFACFGHAVFVKLGGCCANGFAGFSFEEVDRVVLDSDEFGFDFGAGGAFPGFDCATFDFDNDGGGTFGEGAGSLGFADFIFGVFKWFGECPEWQRTEI